MATDDGGDLKGLAPKKYVPKEQWDAGQFFTFVASGRRPISDDWLEYREEVLREHGLADGGDE